MTDVSVVVVVVVTILYTKIGVKKHRIRNRNGLGG